MNQNDGHNNEKDMENIRDWRNEHGQPDFTYLQSLAMDDSLEALEKLHSIAEDLDLSYDPNISNEELVESIRAKVAQNEDGTQNATT
jgi:hypothetical protein